ncbi:hypothetical protein ACFX1T_013077 [Malus domestica]
MGDFNDTMWLHEKKGGRQWHPGRHRYLRNFIQSNELFDLGFSGPCFACEHEWENAWIIDERLDQAIANASWMIKWPSTVVSQGPIVSLIIDH